jgi:hypothetical protein
VTVDRALAEHLGQHKAQRLGGVLTGISRQVARTCSVANTPGSGWM